MIEKQDKKALRFSIFFRGCNQNKFIHITAANVQTFLGQGSLYLKKVILHKKIFCFSSK